MILYIFRVCSLQKICITSACWHVSGISFVSLVEFSDWKEFLTLSPTVFTTLTISQNRKNNDFRFKCMIEPLCLVIEVKSANRKGWVYALVTNNDVFLQHPQYNISIKELKDWKLKGAVSDLSEINTNKHNPPFIAPT